MRSTFAVAAVLGIAAFAALVAAAPSSKPDFSSMKFMLGTWTCHERVHGQDHPNTSTATIGMNGQWIVTHDSSSTSYLGYDRELKKWVTLGVDDSGGYFWASSPGWIGNKLTWNSKGLDGGTSTFTTTKISDTQTANTFTLTDGKGRVTKGAIACAKQ